MSRKETGEGLHVLFQGKRLFGFMSLTVAGLTLSYGLARAAVIVNYNLDNNAKNTSTPIRATAGAPGSSDTGRLAISGNPSSGKANSSVGWKNVANYYTFTASPDAELRLLLSKLSIDDTGVVPNAKSLPYGVRTASGFTMDDDVMSLSDIGDLLDTAAAAAFNLAVTEAANARGQIWAADSGVLNPQARR